MGIEKKYSQIKKSIGVKKQMNEITTTSENNDGYCYTKKDIMEILNVGESTFQNYFSELQPVVNLDYINVAHGERYYNEEAIRKFQLLYASKNGGNANDIQNKNKAIEQINNNALNITNTTNTDILIKQLEVITSILYKQKNQDIINQNIKSELNEIRTIAQTAINRPPIQVQYPTSGYKMSTKTALDYIYKKTGLQKTIADLPTMKMFSRVYTDEQGEHLSNFLAYSVNELNNIK